MKPVEELTDEELRIEIAEFCGWIEIEVVGVERWPDDDQPNRIPFGIEDSRKDKSPKELPDYPNSLDAMWEAEEKLEKSNFTNRFDNHIKNTYGVKLEEVLDAAYECIFWEDSQGNPNAFEIAHATAKQRAIAFVKTIREIKR